MKRLHRSRLIYLSVFLVWVTMSINLYAENISTIKVGLESVYKNNASITISGTGNLEVGIFSDRGFEYLGDLGTSEVTVRNNSNIYYDLGMEFREYDNAKETANMIDGEAVVGYNQLGNFAVYTKQDMGDRVTHSIVEVYNKNMECILVMPKRSDISFASYDFSKGMYLTKVGSRNFYRGAIGIAGDSGITPYNEINLDEYLYGVLPREMSSSFPLEALKAQAVAARSIALYQYDRYVKSGYNVVDTTSTQAYGGYNSETTNTTRAVNETKNEVIKYNGKLAEAVYFSTSGGVTESAVDVWGGNVPYLQSVKDEYETEPAMKPWSYGVKLSDIQSALSKRGVNIGEVRSVKISKRSQSGRVTELTIYGTLSEYKVTGTNVRTFFSGTSIGSLNSTYFSFYGPIGSDIVTPPTTPTVSREIYAVTSSGVSKITSSNLTVVSSNGQSNVSGKLAVYRNGNIEYIEDVKDDNASTGGSSSNLGTEMVSGDFTIYGAGFGHGVGMSQSGAMGMAKAGFGYKDILKHYYTGVEISGI